MIDLPSQVFAISEVRRIIFADIPGIYLSRDALPSRRLQYATEEAPSRGSDFATTRACDDPVILMMCL
jgi:hypothetical protein